MRFPSEFINKYGQDILPPFGHLILSPMQMFWHLADKGMSDSDAQWTIEAIYNRPSINRFFVEDYILAVEKSAFSGADILFSHGPVPTLSDGGLQKLKELYPNRKVPGPAGLCIVGVKPV